MAVVKEKTKKARMEEKKPEILKSESDELKLRRSDEMKGKFNINIIFYEIEVYTIKKPFSSNVNYQVIFCSSS